VQKNQKNNIFALNKKFIEMNIKTLASWALRITAAVILLQTLYYKFTGHPESVQLFTLVGEYIHWDGANPYMRVGTGVMELIASILLLIPSTAFIGALLSLGVISGAIATHLLIPTVGINFYGSPLLFTLAVIVFVCALLVLAIEKKQGIQLYNKFFKKSKV